MKYIVLILILATSITAQLKIEEAFPNLSFDQITEIKHPGDGTDRLFVISQPGKIFVFDNNKNVQQAEVFLDITSKVHFGGEQGLLGLAFHPNYEENGLFFINYTRNNPRRTVVSKLKVSENNPNKAVPESEIVLMEVEQPYSNHNGGVIDFGPDGYLYISFGDGGSGGDPQNHGQNKSTLLGSLVRIDVDNVPPGSYYGIPEDNPFVGNLSGYREEIFAYGLRNVWKFSFDSQNELLYAADVGQNAWEEINIIESGKNYGWRIMEGNHCYNPSSGCDQTGLTLPIHEYDHSDNGGYSITGGYVYYGSDAEELTGKYIYGDFVSGNIWALDYNDGDVNNELLFSTNYSVSTFGVDLAGSLYFASYSNGKIYKISGSPVTRTGYLVPPPGFELHQNFPNPFNPATTISFSLDKKSYTRLDVFDSTGSKISTLVNSVLPKGKFDYTWNGGGFSSGVYIYQLTTDYHNFSRKMILMK